MATYVKRGAPAATIADASTPTAYSAPTAAGSVTVTSTSSTDLDTAAAALETLRDEVAAIVTKFNSVLAALEGAGITLDA